MSNRLKQVMERAQSWPEADQEQAADILLAIEAERSTAVDLSAEDIAALAQSAEDERLRRFADADEIKDIFRRYRL